MISSLKPYLQEPQYHLSLLRQVQTAGCLLNKSTDLCCRKLIYVSDDAPPSPGYNRDQANSFKVRVESVVLSYIRQRRGVTF